MFIYTNNEILFHLDRKELTIKAKTVREIGRGHAWRRGNTFFSKEIRPIIKHLQNRNLDEDLETCMKNYLIIRLISILEDFFKISVSHMVDEYDLPLSILFKGEVRIPVGRFNEMLGNKDREPVTKGKIVANEFNFAKFNEINTVFSELLKSKEKFKELGVDFFSAIKKIDWYDPLRIFKGAWSMNKNWNNFEKMFEIRNDIIHHMRDANLSTLQIISLSDNTLNVMDAAGFVMMLSEIDKIARIVKSKKTIRDEIREVHGQYRRISLG